MRRASPRVPDQSVVEDGGPQSVAAWASGISPGPADESGQVVSFTLTDDNAALFAVAPAVAADGTLIVYAGGGCERVGDGDGARRTTTAAPRTAAWTRRRRRRSRSRWCR